MLEARDREAWRETMLLNDARDERVNESDVNRST